MDQPASLTLPPGLTSKDAAWPVYWLRTGSLDLDDPRSAAVAGRALFAAMTEAMPEAMSGQGLVKVHVGEPRCTTRMRPGLTRPCAAFLRRRGVETVAAGDTTVAYTGPRGHQENPPGSEEAYLELAREHGWRRGGPFDAPFVVLDRPATSRAGGFCFGEEGRAIRVEGINRFQDFYPAGGFLAADWVVNCAHLTLHGLAGVAACVKSVAMGCSGLRGKLRMHQSLLPRFDSDLCQACGICRDSCPEGALTLEGEDEPPAVEPDACIGCGECEAVCARRAVRLEGREITDWERGGGTLAQRMTDYALGLMNGRWERMLHVLHMYTITERCDCLNRRQKPMLRAQPGFLISRNPFALDRAGGEILAQALADEVVTADPALLGSARATGDYVTQAYGVLSQVPVIALEATALA